MTDQWPHNETPAQPGWPAPQTPPNYGPPQPGYQQPAQGGYGPPPGFTPRQAPPKSHRTRNIALSVVGVLVLIIVIGAIAGGGSKKKNTAATVTSSSSTSAVVAAAPVAAGTTTAAAVVPPPVATTAKPSPAVTGAAADITISGCVTSDFGSPEAHLTIKNNSSKTSNYIITIAFDSPDGGTQYDTGLAAVDNLTPGQTSQTDATAFKQVSTKFVCKIASATRYAA